MSTKTTEHQIRPFNLWNDRTGQFVIINVPMEWSEEIQEWLLPKEAILMIEAKNAEIYQHDLGVNCPTCGVAITIENAGEYRTFCQDCAEEQL